MTPCWPDAVGWPGGLGALESFCGDHLKAQLKYPERAVAQSARLVEKFGRDFEASPG